MSFNINVVRLSSIVENPQLSETGHPVALQDMTSVEQVYL
jgi:hypothetical protein